MTGKLTYLDPVAGNAMTVNFPALVTAEADADGDRTFSLNPSNFPGVTDASSAVAGNVGEVLSADLAVGSATSLTTATAKTVISKALTAGDWLVRGVVVIVGASTTKAATTPDIVGISATDNTLPTAEKTTAVPVVITTTSVQTVLAAPTQRINISATTTYYLVASATFSAGTETAWGHIEALRVR